MNGVQKKTQKYTDPNYNIHCMEKLKKEIKEFQVKDDDVFLIGYPKSGTTWATEMVWLIANDLNFSKAEVFIDERFPLLEYTGYDIQYCNENVTVSECHTNSIKYINNMKSPRCIKTHLSGDDLPEQLITKEKNPKIIYIMRNVKDVCISSFHYNKNLMKVYDGSLEEYCNLFMKEGIFSAGNYWESVLYFWNRRHDDNVLIVTYEEMKQNLSSVLQKVAKHLNKVLTKDQELQLMKWLDFESIKRNNAVNCDKFYNQTGFIRVGKINEHTKEMTPELIEKFDRWTKEYLVNTDYEIV